MSDNLPAWVGVIGGLIVYLVTVVAIWTKLSVKVDTAVLAIKEGGIATAAAIEKGAQAQARILEIIAEQKTSIALHSQSLVRIDKDVDNLRLVIQGILSGEDRAKDVKKA